MGPDTMDFGEMEWQMGTADWYMLRVTCMRESGPRIKPMGMAFTLILMAAGMKASGFKINNMGLVSSSGQTVPSMKDSMSKE